MAKARKYSRDNRGRFASAGTGATSRGGRLKTATGVKRATQTRQMAAAPRAGTVAKGAKVKESARPVVAAKPVAAKQQPQQVSKKSTNKAQQSYLAARSKARALGGDLRGADARSRRMANSAAAKVKNMERKRSTSTPKAPEGSPRVRQQQRQAARAQRAIRNQQAAMARELDGPGSKASRSAAVARRARQIYAGKVDPRVKTKSRLTRTSDPQALRKRIGKIKDNTAKAVAKPVGRRTRK